MAGRPYWIVGLRIGVIAAVIASILIVRRLDTTRWGRLLRSKLLLGVPWGTIVTILGLLFVYFVVQDGLGDPDHPVVVAFRAWSYFYPLGMVTSAFAHANPNHLAGNLVGTAALGTLAEFAWGHFPTRRGSQSFGSLRTNPYVRAFVIFPGAAVVVGLVTSVLSWGPVIGFSGVVFAFAGFAVMRYPLGTVLVLVANRALRVGVQALTEPILIAEAEPSFGPPWWAGVSIQGHLLGLFLGVVLGVIFIRHRRRAPSAARLWAGVLLIATSLSLWALWWFRGGETFVLYRGPGIGFVLLIALIVTIGSRAAVSDRHLVEGVRAKDAGILLVLLPVLVIAFVAVPLNLMTVADTSVPSDGEAIQVRDYTVTYAEDVENRMVSVVNLSSLGESTTVTASGVIVTSEERGIWTRSLSKGRLAFAGEATVRVGGLGWRRAIEFERRGWTAIDNGTAYLITATPPDGERRVLYRSPPVMANATLAGKTVAIVPAGDAFDLEVRENGTAIDRAVMPDGNETVALGGLQFVRDNRSVYATYNRTRIRIAKQETYEDT